MSIKKAIRMVLLWVGLALCFNLGIYIFFGQTQGWEIGQKKALEFLGGYIIEQSLSLDNLFLFLLIFSSFRMPSQYQRRILNYGIVGAIILRFIFVILGVTIVQKFDWILYIFGIVLILSGIKMMFDKEDESRNFNDNVIMKLLKRIMPVSEKLEGERFFVKKESVLYATPLFAILFLIEISDIVFAIDSIPAIFSITIDPFIVYTSNIFAIMGLRSMYFVIERLHNTFEYVKYGVATILIFTGIKLGLLYWYIEIPIVASILIIIGILALSIVASILLSGRVIAWNIKKNK